VSKRILVTALIVASVAAAAVGMPLAAAAAAATPCWRQVTDDWFDGSIARTYPLHCYRDALRHLPPDARGYTTAAGDIERALLAATRARGRTAAGPAGSSARGAEMSGARWLQSSGSANARSRMRDESALFERAAGIGSTGRAGTVPLPIVVLGILAGLFVATAGASRLARVLRLRSRPS
jgi:hypothetical protein